MSFVRLAIAGVVFAAGSCASAATCTVSAVSLAFGSYNPFRVSHTDSTGNIAVTCTGKPGEAVTYTLALNAGAGGAFAPRRMRSATMAAINYNLYTNPARSTVWGDGTAGTLVVADSFTLAAATATRNYAVYGRMFARQKGPVGVYTDSIVVTLNF